MAAFREDGKKLVLVNFQTSHEIILPLLDYIEYYHRGPSHLDYYVSWTDLVLQKIVICQVPTRHANYVDFKLIALFDRGLAYLYAGAFFSFGRFFLLRFDNFLKISNLRPLMVYVSLPKSRGAFQYFIKSPKHTTGSTLGTWGLMRINSFLLLIQSPGFIQVSILVLGG